MHDQTHFSSVDGDEQLRLFKTPFPQKKAQDQLWFRVIGQPEILVLESFVSTVVECSNHNTEIKGLNPSSVTVSGLTRKH
jgi:hypothetical protein